MTEGKRGWFKIHSEGEEEAVESSEGSKESKPRTYHMRKELLRSAAGYEDREHRRPGGHKEKIRASPEEVSASLPHMTKEEKKRIQKVLEKAERQAAYGRLARSHLLPEYDSASEDEYDPNAAGSGGGMTQGPITPQKTKGTSTYIEEARRKDVPKPVKDRMLQKFRQELYDNQVHHGRLRPSACAPTPNEEQLRCKHPFEKLRWSSNGDGHYAACRVCHLKHVIYFSERHGAWVVQGHSGDQHDDEERPKEVLLTMTAGTAIMDSGCRSAVAGRQWHLDYQQQLQRL